jgi:multiple sugar transport system substrate-binding protein/sn-glycerol 3-phosphate transport system substrate-binding protein
MKTTLFRLMTILMVVSMILSACSQATTVAPTQAAEQAEPTATTAAKADEPTKEAAATEAPAATESPAATEAPAVVESPYDSVDPSGQTVVFWHNHTRERETALNEIIDEFNKTNEWGITVKGEYQGSYGDIFNKMLTFMGTPDVAQLVVAYQNQAATYQVADTLVDMNSLVNSAKWGLTAEEQADYFPGFMGQDVFAIYNGQRLGFPPNRSMEVMYYNMDWLKELGYDAPPATPEQFKEMACKAAQQPFSKSVAEGSVGYELSLDASRFASWTFAFGGDVFDYQERGFTYDSPAAQEAMGFLQSLFNEGCATLVTEQYGDQTDFGTGKLLFSVGSSSGLPFYGSAVESGAKFAWSVAAIPHTTPNPVMNVYGASVSIPKTTPAAELAAWLFVKYYTSAEVNTKWALASNYFPVRASAAANLTDYFAKNPAYKAAFDLLQYGIFEPPVPGYDFVRSKVQEAMAAIADGGDVAGTLAPLNEEANALLQEQIAMLPEAKDDWKNVDPSGQTIVFWHNHSKERETALNEIIDEFNKTNKWGITVKGEYQGSYGDIFNKMLGVLNTTDAPDIVVAYQNQAATYQVAEALVDMKSLIASPKYGIDPNDQRDFVTGFYNQDVFPNFGGARLGFPPNRSAEMMYYNMDWLKELGYDAPPATPEQFKEMACKAVEQPFSKYTGEGSIGYELSLDASRFASWTFAFGGDVFDYKAGAYTYNSEAAVAAMTFLQDLFTSGCATLVTERYGDQTDFGAGKLLFSIGSTSGLPFYGSAVNEGAQFEWSVAPIASTLEKAPVNIYGASVSIPKTTPERELAAWLFIKYYTSAEVNAKWAVVSNYFPVRKSSANALADYFAQNPTYAFAFSQLGNGKFEPPTVGYDFVRDRVVEVMAAIVDGGNVQELLDALNEEANAILTEYMTIVPTPEPTKAP